MLPAKPNWSGNWGIMGGAFDPIHNGHLILADTALNRYNLNGLLFIPSFNPPHRSHAPQASFDDRFEMTRLAIGDRESYFLSDLEKEIDGPGYTHTIVQYLIGMYPKTSWHLILGQDNIAIFDSWYKPDEIIKLVKIVVGNRPGYEKLFQKSEWKDKVEFFEIPPTDVSSTAIRELLKKGDSINGLVPEAVYKFIKEHRLYL